MRKHGLCHVILMVVLLIALQASNAHAWGPRSMHSITHMALQMIKYDFPVFFRPDGAVGVNFERDVLAGAGMGWQFLADRYPLDNDALVVQAIASEIMLLRELRYFDFTYYGVDNFDIVLTSYFTYRMGALASLVAHAILPYGMTWAEQDHELKRLITEDIEKYIDGYNFRATQSRRVFIANAEDYFRQRRSQKEQDQKLIAHDYRTGLNYNGFMKQGGPTYFVRAVEAVADVWYTILQPEAKGAGFTLSKPSRRALTWYFVDEMTYLLNERGNMTLVERIYTNFEKVNPQIMDAYEQLGDVFHGSDDPAIKLRGVEEWRKAYNFGGANRRRIGAKLSEHFMDEGKVLFERASMPTAQDMDLDNALQAFQRSLDYDRTNESAAQFIQETNVAIRERNERLEVTLSIIATGERVHEEANRFRDARDFANAISTYRQAIGFFEAVDDEFKVHADTAREKIRRLQREISDVINLVLDTASEAISDGDRARDSKMFDDAIGNYQRVPSILAVIPADESPKVAQDMQEIIAQSERKIEEARVEKLRYEQMLQEQAQAGATPQ